MSLLNFLQSSKVEEVKTTAGRSGGVKKQWNPPASLLALRLWPDGSVFPSEAARKKFDLEYRVAKIIKKLLPLKEGETEQKTSRTYEFPEGTGNGFDVIDSRKWQQFSSENGAMLFVLPIAKSEPKVDLFNTVAYEEDGTPKASVMDQGTITFGQTTLIPAVQEIYGIKFNKAAVVDEAGKETEPAVTDGVDFVDLAIFDAIGEGGDVFNITEKYSKPIIFAPKTITRGADKGKPDYVRRENAKVYGLAPAALVIPGYSSGDDKTETPVVNGTKTAAPAGKEMA